MAGLRAVPLALLPFCDQQITELRELAIEQRSRFAKQNRDYVLPEMVMWRGTRLGPRAAPLGPMPTNSFSANRGPRASALVAAVVLALAAAALACHLPRVAVALFARRLLRPLPRPRSL